MILQLPVLPTIEAALRVGGKLRGFLSAGGLRVVHVEVKGELRGYGEHPYLHEALRHAEEDCHAGGRPYAEVYGKVYTHFYTGAADSPDVLDLWLRRGGKFGVLFVEGSFKATLRQIEQVRTPQEVTDYVKRTGERKGWVARGFTYCTEKDARGDLMTKCMISPTEHGADPWLWHSARTGSGMTLQAAFDAAFKAEPVEELND